jgi:hypothetical protein
MTSFWRREPPARNNDIMLLRPEMLEKGKRFETHADADAESVRSERLLRSSARASLQQEYLRECRAGYYYCEQIYCPRCARHFRRWFVGETLGSVGRCLGPNHVTTVLLAKSSNICDLHSGTFRTLIRRRLKQAGLKGVPAIGGFEMAYRAQDRSWVLHINLLTLGATRSALNKFEDMFKSSDLERSTQTVPLEDLPEQISYVLKFTTYHRPFRQAGQKRSPAKPLNAREHVALVKWMSRYQFSDMMFLYGVRREADRLQLKAK